MVNSLSWLLLATCGVDGKTGLLARNDGGIHFLLDLLRTPLELEGGEQSSRSPGSLVAPLLLLCLFTKSSDTNVATISKFSGFQLLCKIADNYRREPRMSEIALEVLSNCCRLDKFATICGRMSPSVTVSTSVISWFARSWTDRGGGRGGDLGGPSSLSSSSSSSSTMRREEVELIESALRLLFRLASSSSNVSSVVCSGCLEHVHFLLNADTTSISSRALCCKVCWKLLSIVRGRGTETRIDFDRLRLWRQQQQGVGGGRGKRRQGRRRKEEEEEESGGGGGEDRNQSAAASILSVGSEGLIEAKEEVEGVVVVSDEDEEMLRQQGCVSPAAKECHLTEMEMDFYRKFPERIDLPSANGADDEDDSDLHGWRTGRQQDDDDDDSSGGVPSLNPRRANIVRRALCDEIERALVEVVDGGRLGAPTFVVHHALLPTTSSPLCRSSLSATEVGRPLRLHSNATRDWISVQRQCINRMMSTRSGKRSGSSSSSSSRDDDDEEVLVYDRDTKVLEGGRLGDQRVTREDLAEKEEEKVKEEEEEEKLRSRIVETRREARRSEEAKRSREVAGAPPSSYGFKCSEEEDLRANSKVEEEVGGRGVPASAMAASGVPESGVQDGSSPSSTWSSRPLVFESRFESGNLDRAFRTGEFEYNLIVTNDTSNRNSTQWYFFSVFGMKRGIRYCFNVINLDKTTSQYNAGMLPCVYSEIKAEEKGEGWFRRGDSVCYYQNLYTKTKGAGPASSSSSSSRDKKTSACFTLSWSDVHDYDGDRVYYSYCLPYTTTDMLAKVRGLDIHEENGGGLRGRGRGGDGGGSGSGDGRGSGEGGDGGGGTKTGGERRSNACGERNILRRTLLCRSLSGLPVPLLTITDFQSTADEIKKRRYVVLSARVHPGESPASFMIDGVIDLLLGDTSLARALRHLAVFKIIPMLNPDGVATGNHRCNLVGHDLNRQWTAPTREESPTIYHLKELLKWQSLSSIDDMSRTRFLSHGVPSDRGVAMFCDFHAHSRSFNIFIYGCESANHVDEKIFPYLLSAANTNFSYKDCNFKIQGPKSKKANCGRIVARKHCGVLNTYTVSLLFVICLFVILFVVVCCFSRHTHTHSLSLSLSHLRF